MQKTTVIMAAAAVSLALAPAFARVPHLNVEKTCRAAQPLLGNEPTNHANKLGNAGAINTYKTCMESEMAARKAAEKLWPKVKAADRANCVGLSRMVYPSYVELLSCLQMYNPALNAPASEEQRTRLPTIVPNRRP